MFHFFLVGGGGGVFLKMNNMLTHSPNPIPNPIDTIDTNPMPIPIPISIDPLNPIPRPNLHFFIILHSPGFELQASDLEVHLHLHYVTQAIIENLLIFVGLISYWSQTRPSPFN